MNISKINHIINLQIKFLKTYFLNLKYIKNTYITKTLINFFVIMRDINTKNRICVKKIILYTNLDGRFLI